MVVIDPFLLSGSMGLSVVPKLPARSSVGVDAEDQTTVAKVLVGVTGGIAAYKAPGVIRRLREVGHEVRTIATDAASRFVPEETLAIATGDALHTDKTWWDESGRVEHVSLARWADLVLVAPATADAMARVAIGLGDDLLSATILAGAKNVLWAPAMNPEMWRNPATRRNVETLEGWGHRFVGPAEGKMASAEELPGVGRLAEEAEILAAVEEREGLGSSRDLSSP
jgi:phosphopantothenoylcysteine decarboxylase/phosphopantothenate--cysteine ligase